MWAVHMTETTHFSHYKLLNMLTIESPQHTEGISTVSQVNITEQQMTQNEAQTHTLLYSSVHEHILM